MLYIRHAQKSYRNGNSTDFSLDPGLTKEGRDSAKIRFTKLIEKYGAPSIIISSPYLRARETAQIASNTILEITGKSVEISYDPLIGEYLGHHTHRNIQECLHPETLIHNPIPPETWKQYSARVRKHTRVTKNSAWYITHGIVIQSIAFFTGKKIEYPSELEGIYLDGNTCISA